KIMTAERGSRWAWCSAPRPNSRRPRGSVPWNWACKLWASLNASSHRFEFLAFIAADLAGLIPVGGGFDEKTDYLGYGDGGRLLRRAGPRHQLVCLRRRA